MKKILLMIMLLAVCESTHAMDVPTMGQLMTAMEQADVKINDLSYNYTMKYWPQGGNKSEATLVLDGKDWYKKSHLYRSETVHVYMPEKNKHTYIIKIEGNSMNTYELLADGTVKKTLSVPAKDWETSGYPPQLWRSRLQKKLDEGFVPVIRYQPGTDTYLVRFDDSPDKAVYKIDGKSWLLYSETVFNVDNNSFVESLDSDFKINSGLSDELFRLPGEADAVVPAVPRELQPRRNARTR